MTDLKRYRLDCADGEWTPYDEAARALLQARADAAAAQALIVERAVAEIDCGCQDGICRFAHACPKSDVEAIRRLAPDAGTAELAKLRERAEKAEDMEAECDGYLTDLGTVIMTLPTGLGMRSAGAVGGVKMLRAERDTLAASLAAQTELVGMLMGALGIVAEEATSDEIPGGHLPPETPDWHRGYDAAIRKARTTLEAAEIATMTPEQQALFKHSMAVRDVAKGIAEGDK